MKFDILSEYCFVNMGQSPASETYNNNADGLPFYQGNADFGEIHPQTRIWCSAPVKIANKGDLLISVRAPIGALNIATEQCCIGRGLAALTPKLDKCRIKYIYFAIQSQINFLIANGTGSTFKAVNKNTLENLLIPVSSLNKQDEIVNIFEKLNNIINKRKEQLLLMDNAVKSRFIEMFGTLNNPKDKFKKDILKNLCVKITDGKHGGCTFVSGTGRYFIGAKEIYNGMVHYESAPEIDIREFEKDYKRCNVEKGDLLIVNTGATIGKSAIAVHEKTKYTLLQKSVALIKTKPDILNSIFLMYCYKINTSMYMVSGASAQANLLLSKINNTEIYVPNISLQNQFADFVEQIDKSKLEIQKSLDKLEILKKSLMQQYFG